jgi:hypothetical protein
VGNTSYEVDLGSVIMTDEYKEEIRNVKICVSEKNGTYYEAFDIVPSEPLRRMGKLNFYVALMECEDDRIWGILLVSRQNELEKHRVIMNKRIGITAASGSSNGIFSNPETRLTDIVVA